MAIRFGTAAHQQLEEETASRLLGALFGEAPGVFGYFLALAVTGVAPSKPRSSHSAPDQQDGLLHLAPQARTGGSK